MGSRLVSWVAALLLVLGAAGAGARAAVGTPVVSLSPARQVLVLPGSACVNAHATDAGGAPLPAQTTLLVDIQGPPRGQLSLQSNPRTDGNGNAQLCFSPQNPLFPIAGDYSISVPQVWPPNAYMQNATTDTAVVTLQFPAFPPPPPLPKAAYSISVSSSVAPQNLSVGDPLTYTATLTNTGAAAAAGVSFEAEGTILTGTLPAVEVSSLTATAGSCSTQTMTCFVDSLAPGASLTMTLTGRAATTHPITLTGYAKAGTPGTGTYLQESSSATVSALPAAADLAVAIPVRPVAPKFGTPFELPIRVTNRGPGPAIGIYLDLKLPSGLKLISCGSLQCGANLSLGNIEPGASANATLTLKATLRRSLQLEVAIQPSPNFTDQTTVDDQATVSIKAAATHKRIRHHRP